MPVRKAEALWQGTLRDGNGSLKLGSGMFEGPYSFPSRFDEGPGTNPEELLGAAHAGCFSMSLASGLAQAGFTPKQIRSTAHVHLEKADPGFSITRIELDCQAEVPGINPTSFLEHAQTAKANCPVSRALAGVEITLKATLME
jgi:osmotically inducible protein OsmC